MYIPCLPACLPTYLPAYHTLTNSPAYLPLLPSLTPRHSLFSASQSCLFFCPSHKLIMFIFSILLNPFFILYLYI